MPYAHQDYCNCGPDTAACIWDIETAAYRCNDPQLSQPRLSAFSLDEGLLDLQPWRGTERQIKNFDEGQIRQFVEEQMPF
mmetsp:Transcript_65145/g.113572  ORF Transcript_65145/g.113572 Transcript_65145/m.113572 type:complete len:80 (+) Transcript_65145:2-241(+)